MPDATVLEKTEQDIEVLSWEEVSKAAKLLKEEMEKIFSSWEEYKNPRFINQGDTKEFERPQGLNGDGLWEINEVGGCYKYHRSRRVEEGNGSFSEEWTLTVQPGGIGVYRDAIISASKQRTKAGQIIERVSPPKNTRGALSLMIEFAKDINGGETPSALLKLLPSSQTPQKTPVESTV